MRRGEITSESLRALCKELGLAVEEDEDSFYAHFADTKVENALGDIEPLFSWDKESDDDYVWAICVIDIYMNVKANEYREIFGDDTETIDKISELRKHCKNMIDLHNKTRLIIKKLKIYRGILNDNSRRLKNNC